MAFLHFLSLCQLSHLGTYNFSSLPVVFLPRKMSNLFCKLQGCPHKFLITRVSAVGDCRWQFKLCKSCSYRKAQKCSRCCLERGHCSAEHNHPGPSWEKQEGVICAACEMLGKAGRFTGEEEMVIPAPSAWASVQYCLLQWPPWHFLNALFLL